MALPHYIYLIEGKSNKKSIQEATYKCWTQSFFLIFQFDSSQGTSTKKKETQYFLDYK